MKVLVTGSEGFIGKNMVSFLKTRQLDFDEFDIKNENKRPSELNIEKYNAVIHLGAISSTTETNIQKIMDQNLSWSIELFEECNKYNTDLQFASSASVYGIRDESQGHFSETDYCRPMNLYAYSKYLFEEYVSKRRSNIKCQMFRYFNVYGPYEEHKGSQASPFTQFTKQARETGVIKVFTNSDRYKRDFINVADLVSVQYEMLFNDIGGIFNLGSGECKSFLDVAKEIAKKHNAKIEIIPFPNHLKDHYQTFTQADMSKTNSLLNYYKYLK